MLSFFFIIIYAIKDFPFIFVSFLYVSNRSSSPETGWNERWLFLLPHCLGANHASDARAPLPFVANNLVLRNDGRMFWHIS